MDFLFSCCTVKVMKTIVKVFVALVAFLPLCLSYAMAPTSHKMAQEALKVERREIVAPDDFQMTVSRYSFVYGVSEATMFRILNCENPEHDTMLQSRQVYTRDHPEWGVKKGDRELSWGVSQIHLPTAPDVSLEEATNMDFSIKYLAREISLGHASRWSCY
jgi:hypothetical protein